MKSHSRKAAGVSYGDGVNASAPKGRISDSSAALEKPLLETLKDILDDINNSYEDGRPSRLLDYEKEVFANAIDVIESAVKKHKARGEFAYQQEVEQDGEVTNSCCLVCRKEAPICADMVCRDCAIEEDFGKVD